MKTLHCIFNVERVIITRASKTRPQIWLARSGQRAAFRGVALQGARGFVPVVLLSGARASSATTSICQALNNLRDHLMAVPKYRNADLGLFHREEVDGCRLSHRRPGHQVYRHEDPYQIHEFEPSLSTVQGDRKKSSPLSQDTEDNGPISLLSVSSQAYSLVPATPTPPG